ncbi:pyroglutamyl-peptidase I [Yersinia frederiksenii]|uniref:pyroglutamyl-peptidase I n=1 Tax=Yersinia frederiksenii TaxID=29484 RepID=UPI0005E6C460|nr:pyroglutamyl-peptidase I [Yersinia frederiksenii]CQI99727.1 pyrrolidone-carboxylate peptidase [Yersinia frederiksenii]
MKSVLITGFEPFGGERVNPSWEVVKQLNDLMLGGVRVVVRQLPCAFGEALTALNAAMDDVQPTLVLAIGQAGGRADITIERVAINIDDARIPDNLGHQPVDQPIVEGGPAAYFTRLPIKAMVQGIRDAGIPASVSQTAGTYVCNHVMYGLLHRLNQMNSDVKGGFIHIPYLPEQAVAHPGAPSMSTQSVLIALELAISVALQIEHDLHISGGAIH